MAEALAAPADRRVLLHICCGPCAVFPVETLRAHGQHVTGFWYNPNIHPRGEYLERLDSCRKMAGLTALDLLEQDEYGLQAFLEATFPGRRERPDRCEVCYRMRLSRAARAAARSGIPAYTTTLLVSPYQNRELIVMVGREAGRQEGVAFLDHDFRQGFREGRQKSRAMGLYQQQYCGCVFSEAERTAARPPGRRGQGKPERGGGCGTGGAAGWGADR